MTDPGFPHGSEDSKATSSPGGVSVVRSVLSDTYVPRPEYEQMIRQLRDAGELHIWLWGDAGTGKTRLARAANRDRLAERDVPVLTPQDEKSFQEQKTRLVLQSGVKIGEVNPATFEWLFASSSARANCRRCLSLMTCRMTVRANSCHHNA